MLNMAGLFIPGLLRTFKIPTGIATLQVGRSIWRAQRVPNLLDFGTPLSKSTSQNTAWNSMPATLKASRATSIALTRDAKGRGGGGVDKCPASPVCILLDLGTTL